MPAALILPFGYAQERSGCEGDKIYLWPMEWIVTLSGIVPVAREFWSRFKDQKVFAFHGAMGAGKTTFIHALCDAKGVNSTVGSPTFSIINEYVYPGGKIFHIDLYRLRDEEEAFRAGVEDCLYSDAICLVEWPEKAPDIFPPATLNVYMETIDHTRRKIHIKASS
jgi:tRNA threonylcarbamoyladenosine biosynthesis protein TsaE